MALGGNTSASGLRQVELSASFLVARRAAGAGSSREQRFDVGIWVQTSASAHSRIGLSGMLRPAANGRYMTVTQACCWGCLCPLPCTSQWLSHAPCCLGSDDGPYFRRKRVYLHICYGCACSAKSYEWDWAGLNAKNVL